jgi:hypothetical protein
MVGMDASRDKRETEEGRVASSTKRDHIGLLSMCSSFPLNISPNSSAIRENVNPSGSRSWQKDRVESHVTSVYLALLSLRYDRKTTLFPVKPIASTLSCRAQREPPSRHLHELEDFAIYISRLWPLLQRIPPPVAK